MTTGLFEIWVFLARSPLLWLTLTLLAYVAGLWLYGRSGSSPYLLPVTVGSLLVMAALIGTGTPYPVYFEGAKFIHFLIGPATVALAVPLYGQIHRLRRIWLPLTVSLLAGSTAAIVSAIGIAWALGGSTETLLSLAPKSATMPIAMAVSEATGGLPSLTAVAVAITGIAGAIMARSLIGALRISDPVVEGFATGITAHAIGTARALQIHETAGAFAALAMGLNGIATAVLVPIVLSVLRVS